MLFFIDIVIYITSFTREIKFDRDTNALGMLEELNISIILYNQIVFIRNNESPKSWVMALFSFFVLETFPIFPRACRAKRYNQF